MAALDTITDISILVDRWKEAERLHRSPVEILERIADIVETELEVFLKSDPDPFDDRHPARRDPSCSYSHVLKCLSKSDNLVDITLNTYLMATRRDFKLCCAASRLLFNLMCCLEMEQIYAETEGFLLRLYDWAENAEEPLRSYSLGLIGMAMSMQDLASSHRENNAHLVPIVINRLKSLKDLRDMSQPAVKEFPKPKIRIKNNGKSNGGNKNKKDSNVDSSVSGTPEASNKASQSSARKGGGIKS